MVFSDDNAIQVITSNLTMTIGSMWQALQPITQFFKILTRRCNTKETLYKIHWWRRHKKCNTMFIRMNVMVCWAWVPYWQTGQMEMKRRKLWRCGSVDKGVDESNEDYNINDQESIIKEKIRRVKQQLNCDH